MVDAISLRESFRKAAISCLKRLYKNGNLKLGGKFAHLQGAEAWEAFCKGLGEMEWVSFIQPPPTKSCSAEHVVRYLTRYLTGGPISDSRIVAADETQVTFLAREGKRVGGQREQAPVTLDTLEFTRRWCEHIQPDQLTKTRYFGGWCGLKRTRYQTRCRELLGQSQEPQCGSADEHAESTESLNQSASDNDSGLKCSACESSSLRFRGSTAKPSWSMLLRHFDTRCPSWYAEQEYEALCEQLEREYGIGYEDWCLEMRIESPMREPQDGRAEPPPQSHQLYLPGLSPGPGFAIESFLPSRRIVASDGPASGRQSSTHDLSDRQAISIKGKVGLRVPDPRIDRNSLKVRAGTPQPPHVKCYMTAAGVIESSGTWHSKGDFFNRIEVRNAAGGALRVMGFVLNLPCNTDPHPFVCTEYFDPDIYDVIAGAYWSL